MNLASDQNRVDPATPKAVTFDCASTLLRLGWTPEISAARCAEIVGVVLPEGATARFQSMFFDWRPQYVMANLTRQPAALHDFWIDLHRAWLADLGLEVALADAFATAGESLTYGSDQAWFSPYPDVVPCLGRLQKMGIRLAVVSNWDISLHRILENLNLRSSFEFVIASLEEGPEKPDPALFHLALERLGLPANEVVHIGDDPVDDFEGAQAVGMRTLLLRRSDELSHEPGVIHTLDQLPEAFAWTR